MGPQRFRNPVPHRGWTGILDAEHHRASCPNSGWFGIEESGGAEDCLFLNVYTQALTGSRPVMVW